jgi:hypothetical protein
MSVLNINSKIYNHIKEDAKKSMTKIGDQASYYMVIGKYFSENPHSKFPEVDKYARSLMSGLKITE